MRTRTKVFITLAAASIATSACASACSDIKRNARPVNLLIVTGGHPYDPLEFFTAMRHMKNIHIEHTLTLDGKPVSFPLGGLKTYDVVLFYDMEPGSMTPEWKMLLGEGRGYVFLHHAIWSFPQSPEYIEIMGGHAAPKTGVDQQESVPKVQADVQQHFHIESPDHPVTCGVRDFAMSDEIYDGFETKPGIVPLLTSDAPQMTKIVGWTWQFNGHRTVYLQPGHGSLGLLPTHGPTAYQNPHFERLLRRAILWAAGRI